MRVAQVLCAGRFAGAESVACSLASALRPHVERSFIYLVVETRADRAAREELLERVRDVDPKVRVFETDRRFSWSLLRRMQSAFRTDKLDVVHSHSYKGAFMAPIIRRLDPAVARVIAFTLHGIDLPPSWGLAFVGTVNAVGALGADVLIACSELIARDYWRWPLLAKKTRCVLNGLSPDFIAPFETLAGQRAGRREVLAKRYQLDPAAVWVATVGRLVEVKNHDLLFRSLARLRLSRRGQEPPIQLLVAGAGPLDARLRERARELEIGQFVRFAGQVSDVQQLYGAVDLLALTSNSEGTPMVVLEAMAYGLPVVATRVGSIVDQVLDGRSGFLIPVDSERALADALRRLVADADLRLEMGQAGYQHLVRRFGPRQWAQRHLEIYQQQLQR